ncbi:hypothetical protein HYPSUDRAFT_201773 [Hypholoma sublateritium FD-334 SS-4]|uniref:Uncharacterized protein n=1 Tax=Hypholoma sublateritium (strain FD-334 SS-4) TaxID=945553 RepID=A0A0D2MH50_HYPSF|nr:hypothetical protein HYPSUDRAFT_201773 [Hypholoma sublateritium FD-334 SS-4]
MRARHDAIRMPPKGPSRLLPSMRETPSMGRQYTMGVTVPLMSLWSASKPAGEDPSLLTACPTRSLAASPTSPLLCVRLFNVDPGLSTVLGSSASPWHLLKPVNRAKSPMWPFNVNVQHSTFIDNKADGWDKTDMAPGPTALAIFKML